MTIETHITLPEDIYQHLKIRRSRGDHYNVSKAFAKFYRDTQMKSAYIEKTIEQKEAELNKLRAIRDRIRSEEEKQIDELQSFLSSNKQMEISELRFIISAKRRIENEPRLLIPNHKNYCSTFKPISLELFERKLSNIDLSQFQDVKEYEHDATFVPKLITQRTRSKA